MALRHESLTLFPHTFFFRLNLQHLLSLCSLRAKASGKKLSVHWQIQTASSRHMTRCQNSDSIKQSITESVNQCFKVCLKLTELGSVWQLLKQHLCFSDIKMAWLHLSIHFLKVNFVGGTNGTFPPLLYIILVKVFQHTHHQRGHPIGASLLATNIISEAMLEKTPSVKSAVGWRKRCCHLREWTLSAPLRLTCRHFSNPPSSTVPQTATSNGLIGLLYKCVEIKGGGGRRSRG